MEYFGDEANNVNKFSADVTKKFSQSFNSKELSANGDFNLTDTRRFFRTLGNNAGKGSVEERFADRVDNMVAMLGDMALMADENADPQKREIATKRFVSHANAAFGGVNGQGRSQMTEDFFTLLQKYGPDMMQRPEMRFAFQMMGVGQGLENYSAVKGHRLRVTKTADTVQRFEQATDKYNAVYRKTTNELRKGGFTVESLRESVEKGNQRIAIQSNKLNQLKSNTVRNAVQGINEQYQRELTAYLNSMGGVQKQAAANEQRIAALQKGMQMFKTEGLQRFTDLDKKITWATDSVAYEQDIINKTEKLNRKIKKGEKTVRDTKREFDKGLKEKGIFDEYYKNEQENDPEKKPITDERFRKALKELTPQREAMNSAKTKLEQLQKLKTDKISLQQEKERLAAGQTRLAELLKQKTALSNAYSRLFTGKDVNTPMEWAALEKMGNNALENAFTLKMQLEATHDTKQIQQTAMLLQRRVKASSPEIIEKKINGRETALNNAIQTNQKQTVLMNHCQALYQRQKQLGTAEDLLKAKCQAETQRLPLGSVNRVLNSFSDHIGDLASPAQKNSIGFKQMKADLTLASKTVGNPKADTKAKTNAVSRMQQSADRFVKTDAPADNGWNPDNPFMSVLVAVVRYLSRYGDDVLKSIGQMVNAKPQRTCQAFAEQENIFDRRLKQSVFNYQVNQTVKQPFTPQKPTVTKPPLKPNPVVTQAPQLGVKLQ